MRWRAVWAVVFYFAISVGFDGIAHSGNFVNGVGFRPTNRAGDCTVDSVDQFPSIKTGMGLSDHCPIIATFAFWNALRSSVTAPSGPPLGNSYAVSPSIETAALNLSGNTGCLPATFVRTNFTSTSASLSAAAIEYAYRCASKSESGYRYRVLIRPFISPAIDDIWSLVRSRGANSSTIAFCVFMRSSFSLSATRLACAAAAFAIATSPFSAASFTFPETTIPYVDITPTTKAVTNAQFESQDINSAHSKLISIPISLLILLPFVFGAVFLGILTLVFLWRNRP